MRHPHVVDLLRDGVLDPRLAALLWLLVEDRVPLVVTGPAPAEQRRAVARAVLSLDPDLDWVVLDAGGGALTTERLAALLRGEAAFGVDVEAHDLKGLLEGLEAAGLPRDGVRRLGAVAVLDQPAAGLRCTSVHYLRPSERDGQGHVQRRPPAVLAAWDAETDTFEDYAWGITPELAARVDRAQADLEERQLGRARFLAGAVNIADESEIDERVRVHLASEPPRVPAPDREAARPSPFGGGLLDPDEHRH